MTTTLTCYRHPNRETRVSCAECGRGLCPDCMVFTPVGIKCAEHAGVPTGAARVMQNARRFGIEGEGALLTKILIAVNVLVFLWQVASAPGSLSQPYGYPFQHGALNGYLVANGEWWRLGTSMFLHGGITHLALNMLFLWWIGAPVEQALGRARYALIYFVSGLAGATGALLLTDPGRFTVGASGALFGILGAAFVFERQRNYVLGGSALTIIVLNIAFTFVGGFAGSISIGGHLGGLAGGALSALALSRLGRAHAAYGKPGLAGIAGVVAVGVASVAISMWAVEGYL